MVLLGRIRLQVESQPETRPKLFKKRAPTIRLADPAATSVFRATRDPHSTLHNSCPIPSFLRYSNDFSVAENSNRARL